MRRISSPSLWRVNKPSIPQDLRKFNDRLRDLPEAIRRRTRSGSQNKAADGAAAGAGGGSVGSGAGASAATPGTSISNKVRLQWEEGGSSVWGWSVSAPVVPHHPHPHTHDTICARLPRMVCSVS